MNQITTIDDLFTLFGAIVIVGFIGIYLWVVWEYTVGHIRMYMHKNNIKNTYTIKRQTANLELLYLLRRYVLENPEQRLGQALINLGITNPSGNGQFYEEPDVTLSRVKKILEELDAAQKN